jgi:GNAT superfamily N-acetyltransferase
MMELQIRSYRASDSERLAEIVRRCAVELNSRDYPPQIIERVRAYFSAERFTELSGSRCIYVAEAHVVLGTVSRDGNKVYTMFVDPDWAGNGIGRQLMSHVEQLAADEGYDHVETGASITARNFYLRLGYIDLRESETDFGLNYIMRKPLG